MTQKTLLSERKHYHGDTMKERKSRTMRPVMLSPGISQQQRGLISSYERSSSNSHYNNTHTSFCKSQGEAQGEQFMALSDPDRLNFFALPECNMKKASTQGKYFCWQSDQSMLTSLFLTIHWSVWVWSLCLKAGS